MSIVKLNNRGVRSATAFGSITGLGSMTFIKKQTASSSSTISFVDGTSDVVLDDTYKEYLFTFKNIHPATDDQPLTFQANAAGGSGYDETMTTTYFRAYHLESGGSPAVGYDGNRDLAQSTSFQQVISDIGNGNDENGSGYLYLFNPSSTTFVKHFMCKTSSLSSGGEVVQFIAGYFNTTSAIDEIQFKMASGNIDAGTISLYGIN